MCFLFTNLEVFGDINSGLTALEGLLFITRAEDLRKVSGFPGDAITRVSRGWRLRTGSAAVVDLVRVSVVVSVVDQLPILSSPVIGCVTVPVPTDTICSFVVRTVQL